MKNIYNKIYKKHSYNKYNHRWFTGFFTITIILLVISVFTGYLSLIINKTDNEMIFLTPNVVDSFSDSVKDYSNVFINVIIAVGIAVITIDSTIFVFSKTALDRINDENKYISNIVKTHKETMINLLGKICGISLAIIILSIVWHLALSFCYNVYKNIFYISIASLFLGAVFCILASINFLMRCINNENYLRFIIQDKQQELEALLDKCLPLDSSDRRLKHIGDWQTWFECDYLTHAKKECRNMKPYKFINLFQLAEQLLISLQDTDDSSSYLVNIISSFYERESMLNVSPDIQSRDLSDQFYFTKDANTLSVIDSINSIEQKIGYDKSIDTRSNFFNDTEKLYFILREYCNLLISEKYTSTESFNIIEKDDEKVKCNCKRKDKKQIEMNLPRFTEAFYYFYLRILSMFVSLVKIKDLSFNYSSLNYANFYNSTLENVSLYGASFYRTVLSRTTFKNVIMDMSEYEDIVFYGSNLIDTTMNNSKLEQVSYNRASIKSGGFDSCSFTTCKFIDSDFTDCNFNNTEYVDSLFVNSIFVNSKFRDNTIQNGSYQACSFINSDFSDWTVKEAIIMEACDFSKSTWSKMIITNWDLSECVFAEATLVDVKITDTVMKSVDFSNCSLSDSIITNCKMNSSNLKNASLFAAHFENVDLSMADLSSANAVEAIFQFNCIFKNTNCDNADFSKASIIYADLEAARLYNCSFTRSIIQDTNCKYILADKMQFTFATCTKSDFSYGSLSNSNMTRTSFSECKFIGADLSEVNATKTTFEKCVLLNTDFSDTRFVKANFHGACSDNPMIITNCDFSNCKFEKVSFKNVRFINCIFTDSIMIKCKNSDGELIGKNNAEDLFGSDWKSITFYNKPLDAHEK